MVLVRQLVRYLYARGGRVVHTAEQLARLKDHLDNVPIAVRDGTEIRIVHEVEDVHRYRPFSVPTTLHQF